MKNVNYEELENQIEIMMDELDIGKYGEGINLSYLDDLTIIEAFGMIAEDSVDISTDLLTDFLKENSSYVEDAIAMYGNQETIWATIQKGQVLYIEEDLTDRKDDIVKYYILDGLVSGNLEYLNVQSIEQVEECLEKFEYCDLYTNLSDIWNGVEEFFQSEKSLDDIIKNAEGAKDNQEKSDKAPTRDDLEI